MDIYHLVISRMDLVASIRFEKLDEGASTAMENKRTGTAPW